ncbi:MAG: hypothetical protein V4628_11680 [Pseudomonadota bacterium]
MSNPAQSFSDADYKQASTIEAIDKLLQCAATDFAGMDYPALKKLSKASALPVSEVLAAYGKIEKAKQDLFDRPLPLDSEKE